MDTGTIISGVAHLAVLAWLALGGFFQRAPEDPVFEAADVQLISSEEFAALTRPETPPDVAIETPEPPAPPVADAPNAPEPPPAEPETPEVPEPPTPPAPPEPDVSDLPPAVRPPQELVLPEDLPESDVPQPDEAPRVAPEPVPDSPDAPEVADTPTPEVDPDAEPDRVAEEEPPAAPEEATTEIVTEAEEPSRAPETSFAPPARPAIPVAAEPAPETETPPAETPAADDPLSDAVNDALADALSDDVPAPPGPPAGPPLTFGEKESFRVAVASCWNRGALSSAAERVTVVVGFAMNRDGTPDAGSIRMLSASGGDDTATRTAFEAASRAIRRCGARGFDLPAEKFAHWQEVEIVFRASGPSFQ